MFDLVFDALMAWNQIGLLLMGTVFTLIGGGLAGYELYWRLKAKKVKGVISEVRVKEYKHGKNVRSRKSTDNQEDLGESFKKKPVATGFILLLFIGLPLIFSGVGVYMGYNYYSLKNTGEYAQATVVRNESSYDSDSGTTYHAVLGFYDRNGKYWEVEDNISYGNSPSYSSGTKIGVYYKADDPEKFVIDDFWHNMAIAVAFFTFGMVFISIIGLALSFGKSQQKSGKTTGEGKAKTSAANEMYYAVFEYKAPNGDRMEKVSDMGSNGILGKIPGKRVILLMFPDNPEKVRRPALFLLIFGMIFMLPGVFVLHMAVTQFETNVMTILMILAGVGFIAYKIQRFIAKIPLAEFKEFKKGWAELKKQGVTVTSSSNMSGKDARPLDQAEIMARVRKQAGHAAIGGYVMLLIALALSGGAYYAGLGMLDKVQNGLSAKGKVVDLNSRYSSSSDSSGYTYYAVVEYIDRNGRKVRFEDSVGSSHPMFKRGDKVDVLYMEEKPADAIIDRGIWNWSLSGGLVLGALLLLWWGLHSLTLARRYGGSKYRGRV